MGRIQSVHGANFGDEGKGRTVSWLASQANNPLVVRHNSGAQAGHTVEVDGKKHIFSHFGSGTLVGAPTFLAHRFVVNPTLFNEEYDELRALGITPVIYVSAKCAMSSPLDLMLNRCLELWRGEARHGSVGIGFGETIRRGLAGKHLTFHHGRRDILQSVLGQWFLDQTDKRNFSTLPPELRYIREALWNGSFAWHIFWQQHDLMQSRIRIVPNPEEFLRAWNRKGDLIFEGAQGLALHQDTGVGAPDHSTWSRTGLEDVVEFLDHCKVEGGIQPHYISRAYLTRHGNGPFDNEQPTPEWLIDPTNVPNDWQGTLRYAPFDARFTLRNIIRDLEAVPENRRLEEVCVLTCADQVPELTKQMTRGFADWIFHSPRHEAPELYQYRGD